MATVPEAAQPARHLHIVADLQLEVGDDRGQTSARLTNDSNGLVLDVDEPAVLLRAVPGRGLSRDLPISVPKGIVDGTSVLLRSRGRHLGRVQFRESGRVRFRPTLPGLVVAGRTATSYRAGRLAATLVLAVAAAVGVALVGRRRDH